MWSPNSCRLCNCPLEVVSASGLCPTCLRSADTSIANSESPPPAVPFPVPLGSDAPQPEVTPSFAPRVPDASTARVPPGGLTPAAREAAQAADQAIAPVAPAAPATISLPPAPAGYELLRHLGGGGMGDVFLAREQVTQRMVAMKFLRAAGNPAALDRFVVEVRALAALNHPNIVRVLSTDFMRVDPFFTMEWADSGSLAKWVEQHGPLDPMEAARIVATIARAVAAAHAANILHRDIKPSNILLATSGQVPSASAPPTVPGPLSALTLKVSDFGLAKRLDQDDGLTVGSGPLGTPSYMPPEQISTRNGEIGPASDVYGLGATLYHILTGRPPFGPGPQPDVVQQVLNNPVRRLRAIRPEIPPVLEGIVVKCLEKDPNDRYASANKLADDLDRFLAGEHTDARPLTPLRRARRWLGRQWAGRNRKRLVTTGLAAFLAVALGAAGAATPPPQLPEPLDTPAEIRKNLAAGRSVELVPEKGLPVYALSRMGPLAIGESELGDKSAAIHPFYDALLELCPAPGITHYQITLELRHIQEKVLPEGPLGPNGTKPETAYLGFYFGYAAAQTPDKGTVHAMFAVTYREAQERADGRASVYLRQCGLFQAPDGEPGQRHSIKYPGLSFTPKTPRPGKWRRIILNISPDKLHIQWIANIEDNKREEPQTLLKWDNGRAAVEYEQLQRELDAKKSGSAAVLPTWSPNMPFGIMSRRSSVTFRNVVITPLRSI